MPTLYIDVRTKKEFDEGHREGALNAPLSELQEGNLPNLPKDTDISLYCHSGARSAVAKDIFELYGFTNVKNAGGYP